MRIEKFKGKDDEDYDTWCADLHAFFKFYDFSEEDEVRLYNAHLGGEARKFITN